MEPVSHSQEDEMPKRTFTRAIVALTLMAIMATLVGCGTTSPEQIDPSQGFGPVTPTGDTPYTTGNGSVPIAMIDRIAFTRLEELVSDPTDLIIEGTITSEMTQWVQYTDLTNAELAQREAAGLPTGALAIYYKVMIDKVLKGQTNETTVTVTPAASEYSDPSLQVGDRVILFLRERETPTIAPGQTEYMVIAPEGQFRIEKDNTLSTYLPPSRNPVADTYRGQDKSILEKGILDLVSRLPQPTKEEALEKALSSATIVIKGTIQGIRQVHFINALEKPQEWIDQMLAEGKMPGLVLTDYTVIVDRVLFEMAPYQPRFFPDWKPLQPGQTIIVTRQGGTYRGVTSVEEPGAPFEIGSQEVLFLVPTSFDIPDDAQVRYTTDSRRGRFLIGPDNKLIAFTTKGLGAFYDGQNLHQLEQDIAELLRTHPFGP
jgi:hypothetical protein